MSQDNPNIPLSTRLYQREALKEHTESIRSASEIKQSRATQIIDNIFKHFPATFSPSEPDFYHGRKHTAKLAPLPHTRQQPSADWLGWYFYHYFYTTVQLTRGTTGTGTRLTTDQFIDEITSSHPNDDRNGFHFLVGNIGEGKTAYINWLITTQFTGRWPHSNFWFLRLNPDYQTFVQKSDSDDRKRSFFSIFRRRLEFVVSEIQENSAYEARSLSRELIGQARDHLKSAEIASSLEDLTKHLTNAITTISQLLNRKFLLIIDNLDSFFHDHDRYLFLNNDATGEDQSVSYIAQILIEFFHVTSPLGRFGGDLLIVVRPDAYQLMKEKRQLFKGFEACFHEDRNAYTVDKPNWRTVIRQRLHLLKEVERRMADDAANSSVCSHISTLLEDLDIYADDEGDPEVEIFVHLRQISNQGIRSVVDFFSMYAWLPDNSDVRRNLTRRYIDHQPVGLIAYMLNNRMLFSQAKSGFPNVFMINAAAFGDDNIVRMRSNNKLTTKHAHTYLLKILILRYLYHLTFQEPENVTIETILDVFCGSRDQSCPGYYGQNIVRIVMGSFAQTHQTSLIEVGRKVSPDGSSLLITGPITLTQRGKYLIEELAFTFPYLQLVVDDNYLLLPRTCKEFFRFDPNSHYGYLVNEPGPYVESADLMLLRKIPRVAKFLAILSVANEIERQVYSGVFQTLKEFNVRPLDMGQIVDKFIHEVRAISKKKGQLFRNNPQIRPDYVRRIIDAHAEKMRKELPCVYPLQ